MAPVARVPPAQWTPYPELGPAELGEEQPQLLPTVDGPHGRQQRREPGIELYPVRLPPTHELDRVRAPAQRGEALRPCDAERMARDAL